LGEHEAAQIGPQSCEHVGEPRLRINIVELAGLN
jgi:hypothetical protein